MAIVRLKIISIILLTFCSLADAGIEALIFERITIEDGLSESSVRAIHQDKLGYMWFGTEDGLNRYDCYNFILFKNNQHDTNSIISNYITDIDEDFDGKLWIATINGVSCYDPSIESFYRFASNNSGEKIGKVFSILPYKNPQNKLIWFAISDGIYSYNLSNKKYRFYGISTEVTSPQKDNKIYLFQDRQNTIWAISNISGIYMYERETDDFIHIEIPNYSKSTDGEYTELFEDSEGYLWFGSIRGLNKYNPKTGEFKVYREIFERKLNKTFKTNFVNCIKEDDRGNLLLATSGYGLIIFNKSEENIDIFQNDPYDSRTISSDVAHTVYKDRNGLFWFGTHGNGIYIFSPYLNKFNLVKKTVGGLSSASVRTFFEDSQGYLWISGYTGIDRYNPSNGKYKSYFNYTNDRNNSLIDGTAYCIIQDKQNENISYFGTEGSGLFEFNSETQKFIKLFPETGKVYNSGDFIIRSLFDDGEGILWIGSANGLFAMEKNYKNPKEITDYKNFPSNPFPQTVTVIYRYDDTHLLIGTDQAGLFLLDKTKGEFAKFKTNTESTQQNSEAVTGFELNMGESIKCIHKDQSGKFWIGTTTGLAKIDSSRKLLKIYSVQDGLPNDVIYGILQDSEDNLWMSTNLGICKLNPQTNEIFNYDIRDGLQSNEFNTNAFLKTRNGLFLFGGINGFNSFFPDAIHEDSNIPHLGFTDFKLFNKSITRGEIVSGRIVLEKSISHTDVIKLDYNENVFTIEFTAFDYLSSGKNLYSYKLEGFDNDWSEPSQNRTVTYTNLDPGAYTLKVIGANGDKLWNKEGISLDIIINPPYWLTWWFFLLSGITLASILYGIYRYRLLKMLELERLRISIASDLHDDIGSTLSKLALRADIIKQTLDDPSQRSSLQRIAEMSRQAVGTMQDIVWSIDSRNDTFESMLNKMKDFTYSTLTDKEVKVQFTVSGFDSSLKVPVEVRQNLYLILKEAVNNITKHSNADSVYITINHKNHHFMMLVKDNGTNFRVKEFSVGHGLKNMKMRADKINAEIECKNDNGFIISVKGKLKT